MKPSRYLKPTTVRFSTFFTIHLPQLNQHLNRKVGSPNIFSKILHFFFLIHFLTIGHRVQREELDAVLVLLEKILLLLPELLQKRWQKHALTRLFKRLLHPANNTKLRKDAMK
jgi:hypothetical protein